MLDNAPPKKKKYRHEPVIFFFFDGIQIIELQTCLFLSADIFFSNSK